MWWAAAALGHFADAQTTTHTTTQTYRKNTRALNMPETRRRNESGSCIYFMIQLLLRCKISRQRCALRSLPARRAPRIRGAAGPPAQRGPVFQVALKVTGAIPRQGGIGSGRVACGAAQLAGACPAGGAGIRQHDAGRQQPGAGHLGAPLFGMAQRQCLQLRRVGQRSGIRQVGFRSATGARADRHGLALACVGATGTGDHRPDAGQQRRWRGHGSGNRNGSRSRTIASAQGQQ